jgi:hypothetical protein
MSQPELLAQVARLLENAGIPYMITGSHASSAMGQPRSTHDIDFVVQMQADDVRHLASAFAGERFGFDEVGAKRSPEMTCSSFTISSAETRSISGC